MDGRTGSGWDNKKIKRATKNRMLCRVILADILKEHGTKEKKNVFACEQNGNERNFKGLLVINIGQATRHTSGKIATC